MLICQSPNCKKLANMTSGYCHEHEKKESRVPLGGSKGAEILAIMVGDKLKIGITPDDVEGVVYDIMSIEGDDGNAQIYLQPETDHISPQRVIHFQRVD